MGLFDFFKGGSSDGKAQKYADTVRNPKAIRDDRLYAIDSLCRIGDASQSVPGLLQRFEYSLEHSINDSREKDMCLEGIVSKGDAALPFVLEHLKTTTRIAWPIKILKALGRSDEHVIECLVATLNFGDTSFDQAQTDKNYDILCHLVDYQRPGLCDRVASFLKDPDERVRFAATEVMLEQDFAECGRYVEPLLSDQNPDNSRIKQTIVRKYLEAGWLVEHPDRFPDGRVIGPVFVGTDRKLFLQRS